MILFFKIFDYICSVEYKSIIKMKAKEVIDDLRRRFPNEPEYLQAVEEVLMSIEDVYNEHPEFERYNLIERL